MLHAEHLDVGFMLSWFHRRHKVSQRLVCVLERLPRRGRRVSRAWAFGHQQRGQSVAAVVQVLKGDVCILQDGRVVEAVCMECTNFGEEYEVSPQQSIRAALRGLFPRNL